MELSDKIIDTRSPAFDELAFYDFIESTYDPVTADVLKMHYENHKKTEIIKKHQLSPEQYAKIIEDFATDFA